MEAEADQLLEEIAQITIESERLGSDITKALDAVEVMKAQQAQKLEAMKSKAARYQQLQEQINGPVQAVGSPQGSP